jgi:hypothetical protein
VKKGDILILAGGQMAMILDVDFPGKGDCRVQFMEREESCLLDMKKVIRESVNCGSAVSISIPFLIGRSIHSRLNALHKV